MHTHVRFFLISIISLLTAVSLNFINAEAKIACTNKTDAYTNNPVNSHPSVLSEYTTLNENGIMIYDDDTIKQQTVVETAANHWNDAVGMKMIMSYREARVDKEDADVTIIAADLPTGVGGNTWGNGIHIGQKNLIKISNNTLNSSESDHIGFTQAVSTVSHEMGHALGLNHDSGPLMGSAGAYELKDGILPDIPYYNVNAIGNYLNDLNQIYTEAKPIKIPNMVDPTNIDSGTSREVKETDSIYAVKFDGIQAMLVTRDFTRGTLAFHINQNLMEVGTGKVVGTTNSLGITNKEVPIVTTYAIDKTSAFPFYQIKVNGKYYIVNGGYNATAQYDDHQDSSTSPTIEDTDPLSKMRFDSIQSQLLTRDFTPKKIKIIINQNVYQLASNAIRTTDKLEMTNQTVNVITTYTSTSSSNYYQIKFGYSYYIINARFTEEVDPTHL